MAEHCSSAGAMSSCFFFRQTRRCTRSIYVYIIQMFGKTCCSSECACGTSGFGSFFFFLCVCVRPRRTDPMYTRYYYYYDYIRWTISSAVNPLNTRGITAQCVRAPCYSLFVTMVTAAAVAAVLLSSFIDPPPPPPMLGTHTLLHVDWRAAEWWM